MTKVDARTSLSKCSTVSARISQKTEDSVEDILMWMRSFWPRKILISSFVRRNSQGTWYYLAFLRLHNKLTVICEQQFAFG